MFDLKNISMAAEQIAQEKGISKEKVLEVLEAAIASAYKKEYRKKSETIRAKFNLETGELQFSQIKMVVDESMLREEQEQAKQKKEKEEKQTEEAEEERKIRFNPDRHIMIEEAKKIRKDVSLGDEMEFPIEAEGEEEFGRIAAQTAKQVILQRIREAEREAVYEEFKDREEKIVSGVVQRIEGRNVFVDLGRAVGLMPAFEIIPGERYRIGERLRFFVTSVEEDIKGSKIILSRHHPKFISKLFELEVPEIAEGIVVIKSIAREPGSRTKMAVFSEQEGVDPVGSCVGQKGMRVMAVLNEIGQEKVDIVEWSEDFAKYVANALAPAKVKDVEVGPRREMRVFVLEDQLSLAIGKGGQNVRLAAKLTGFKIDVRSYEAPEKPVEGGVAEIEEPSSAPASAKATAGKKATAVPSEADESQRRGEGKEKEKKAVTKEVKKEKKEKPAEESKEKEEKLKEKKVEEEKKEKGEEKEKLVEKAKKKKEVEPKKKKKQETKVTSNG